jgi:hypothetical protein
MAKTAKRKPIKELALVAVIGTILRFVMTKLGWHPPSLLGDRVFPALVLWMIFGLYWGIAGLNSAPTESSESDVQKKGASLSSPFETHSRERNHHKMGAQG